MPPENSPTKKCLWEVDVQKWELNLTANPGRTNLLILCLQSHVLCFFLLFNAVCTTDFIEIEVSVH